MVKHLEIKLSGKVQGVFFRASAKHEAERLGVKGFVKNEMNGDVYVEVEANEDVLQEFINWCKEGPPLAEVHKISIAEGKVLDFKDFVIK